MAILSPAEVAIERCEGGMSRVQTISGGALSSLRSKRSTKRTRWQFSDCERATFNVIRLIRSELTQPAPVAVAAMLFAASAMLIAQSPQLQWQ